MKDILSTSSAKNELIENRWDRVIFEMTTIASNTRDKGMLNII